MQVLEFIDLYIGLEKNTPILKKVDNTSFNRFFIT
jgi:hypothetical protein